MKSVLPIIAAAAIILAVGCSSKGGGGGPCGFSGSCPSGWTSSGGGCVYSGPSATISGKVIDFLTSGLEQTRTVTNAHVTIIDNTTGLVLPLCGTTDANGFVAISGVPTDIPFGYKVHALKSEGAPDNYLDTYRFNLSADPSSGSGREFSDGTYEYIALSEVAKNLVAVSILSPDPAKGVVAGSVEDQRGVKVYGVKATSDPIGSSINYFVPSQPVPVCNPEYNDCRLASDTATSTGSDGLYVVFDLPQTITSSPPWKVTSSAIGRNGAAMGSTNYFAYPNSVSLSDIFVTRDIDITGTTVTASASEAAVAGPVAPGKTASATLYVSLMDNYQDPVTGYFVSGTTPTTTATAALGAGADHDNGIYTAPLTDTISEAVTVTAYAEGIQIIPQATVNFVAVQNLSPPAALPLTGTAIDFTETVLVGGIPTSGRPPTVSASPVTAATINSIYNEGGGNYTVSVTGTVSGQVTFYVDDVATGARRSVVMQFQ